MGYLKGFREWKNKTNQGLLKMFKRVLIRIKEMKVKKKKKVCSDVNIQVCYGGTATTDRHWMPHHMRSATSFDWPSQCDYCIYCYYYNFWRAFIIVSLHFLGTDKHRYLLLWGFGTSVKEAKLWEEGKETGEKEDRNCGRKRGCNVTGTVDMQGIPSWQEHLLFLTLSNFLTLVFHRFPKCVAGSHLVPIGMWMKLPIWLLPAHISTLFSHIILQIKIGAVKRAIICCFFFPTLTKVFSLRAQMAFY